MRDLFDQLLAKVQLVASDQASVKKAREAGQKVFIASANSELKIGTELDHDHQLVSSTGPLGLRLIGLPESIFDILAENKAEALSPKRNQENAGSLNTNAAGIPLSSSLDFGQQNPAKDLVLVEGAGTLEEILACFQMLGKLLKLPFRRDSIEKVVRDSLRRGQPKPSAFGAARCKPLPTWWSQTARSARVRMQPSTGELRRGFALAGATRAPASDSAQNMGGFWFHEKLNETCPQGIALLMDRTSNLQSAIRV